MADRDRETLTEQIGSGYDEGGLLGAVGAGVKGAAEMMLPQGSVFQDFVEFSPVGDVQDAAMAVNPDSDLDWLERGLALLPVAGFTTAATFGAQRAYVANKQTTRQQEFTTTDFGEEVFAQSTTPEAGTPYGFFQGDGSDLSRRNQAARLSQEQELGANMWRQRIATSETFEDLALGVIRADGAVGKAFDENILLGTLRAIGNQIVAEAGPDVYGAPDMSFENSPDVQALVAAQSATLRWLRAAEEGILKYEAGDGTLGLVNQGDTVRTLGTLPKSEADLAKHLDSIVRLELGAKRLGLGPGSLAPTPQTRVGEIVIGKDGSVDLLVSAVGELLPTTRLVGREVQTLDNKGALSDRLDVIDYETLVGDGAVNLVNQIEGEMDRGRFAESSTWYERANGSAQYLAGVTGLHPSTVGAVISSLSPRTSWAPDNLVASVHAVLRYSTDLDPFSPEYREHFKKSILAGDWVEDLYRNSNQALRAQFKNDHVGLLDFYADIANLETKKGNVRGMSLKDAQNRVKDILGLGIPWEMVLRHTKTHEFAHLIGDPSSFFSAVIDVHSNNAFFGTTYAGEPKGSGQTRRLSDAELDAGYQFETTGRKLTRAMFDEARQKMEDAGFPKAEIERKLEAYREVPSETVARRYRAQRLAHQLAAKQLGLDTANQAQSTSWIPSKFVKDLIGKKRMQARRAREAYEAGVDVAQGTLFDTFEGSKSEALLKARQELESVLQYAVWDRSIVNHAEGNPTTEMPVPGLTARATDSLDNLSTHVMSALAAKQSSNSVGTRASEPIVVRPNNDGSVSVFADPEFEGALDSLRHLAPTAWSAGSYRVMVPRKPRMVRNVDEHVQHLADQVAADGLPVYGNVYTRVGDTADGLAAGNRMVFDVSSMEQADALAAKVTQVGFPFKTEVRQTARSSLASPRTRIGFEDLADWDNAVAPGGVFETQDWITMSAEGGSLTDAELRADLEALGVEPIRVDGVYDSGNEPSYVAFGVKYADVVRLGRKYGQKSVATRNGLIFTTGENAGTFWPATGEFDYGKQAEAFEFGHTSIQLPDGSRRTFVSHYDSDAAVELPADVNSLHLAGSAQQSVSQVVVDLGGVEAGVDWKYTDRVWEQLSKDPAVSNAAAYLHGDLWRPEGTEKVFEHSYADGAGRMSSIRSRNGSWSDRNASPVYVRRRDAHQVAEIEGVGSVRPRAQAKKLWQIDDDLNTARIDGDIELHFPPGTQVDFPHERTGPLRFEIDGVGVRQATMVLSEGVPQLTFLPGGMSGPGMVQIDIKNGRVSALSGMSRTDVDKTIDALGAMGVDPSSINLDRVNLVDGTGEVEYTPNRITDADNLQKELVRGRPSPETSERNRLATLKVGEAAGLNPLESARIVTSDVVTDTQSEILTDTLSGLFGAAESGPLKRFTDEFGPLPSELFSSQLMPGGIQVATIMGRKNAGGGVILGGNIPYRGITLNERLFAGHAAGNLVDRPGMNAGHGHDRIEVVVVHEFGHIVHQATYGRGRVDWIDGQINQATSELNGWLGVRRTLSHYATESNHEFFAEAFAEAVFNPDAPVPIKNLIRTVLDYVAGGE